MLYLFDMTGSPHSNRSDPEIHQPPELVEELVLEGITEMLDMPNRLSSSPARTLPMEDHGNEGSPFITAPTEKETQDSMDQGTKSFAFKNDTTASLGGRSIITTAPHLDPDIIIIQHDVALDINICQYPEESTIETSSDYLKGTDDVEYPEESTVEISSEYVKGTDDVVQTMNGKFVCETDICLFSSSAKHKLIFHRLVVTLAFSLIFFLCYSIWQAHLLGVKMTLFLKTLILRAILLS